jgi:hypothetical protein
MAKTLEEIILSILDSSEADNLVFGQEDSQSAIELFESVQACLNFVSDSKKIDGGLPEADISHELESTFDTLIEQQNSTTGYQIDPVAIAFYKLGQSVGRQQVLRRNILPLRRVIEDRVIKSDAGRKATSNREGITFIASKILERYVKEHPDAINLQDKCLIRGAKTKLKNKLVELFDFNTKRGMNNCQVCGLYDSLSDRTAKDKVKHVVDVYFNDQFVEIEPELMKQLILW